MDYNRGLDMLRSRAKGTMWYQDFTVFEASLRENLHDEHRYGSSEQIRRDRIRVVDQLNSLALRHLGISYNDLCLSRGSIIKPQDGTKGDGEICAPESNTVKGSGNTVSEKGNKIERNNNTVVGMEHTNSGESNAIYGEEKNRIEGGSSNVIIGRSDNTIGSRSQEATENLSIPSTAKPVLASWTFFSIASGLGVVIFAVVLWWIPSLEWKAIIAVLTGLGLAVTMFMLSLNPINFYRRWLSYVIPGGMLINALGFTFDVFFSKKDSLSSFQWNGAASGYFFIAWAIVTIGLVWGDTQQKR